MPLERLAEIIRAESFGAHMGIELEELRAGYARVRMSLEERHINFHKMVHGGAIFGLADAAFAAASNSFGTKAVAVHVGIDYLAPIGDSTFLTAEAEFVARAGKIGNYEMRVKGSDGELIATCRGWVYYTGRPIE